MIKDLLACHSLEEVELEDLHVDVPDDCPVKHIVVILELVCGPGGDISKDIEVVQASLGHELLGDEGGTNLPDFFSKEEIFYPGEDKHSAVVAVLLTGNR